MSGDRRFQLRARRENESLIDRIAQSAKPTRPLGPGKLRCSPSIWFGLVKE